MTIAGFFHKVLVFIKFITIILFSIICLTHAAVVQYVYTISYAKPCTSINIFTGVYWTTAGEVPAVIVPIDQNIIWYNNSTLIAMGNTMN